MDEGVALKDVLVSFKAALLFLLQSSFQMNGWRSIKL